MNLVLANGYRTGAPLIGPFHLIMPHAKMFERTNRQIQDTALPNDFPDYLVYMTRNSLYASTTSLSKISASVHEFFLQLSAMLAFERMVRSFWAWSAAARAPWLYAVQQPWPWLGPVTHQKQPLPFWGANGPALPKPVISPDSLFGHPTPAMSSTLPVLASAISASMALMTFAPALIHSWTVA